MLKSSPYPLFFLRYSLFAILYPTGIVGEVMTMVAALPDLKVGPCVSVQVRSLYLYLVAVSRVRWSLKVSASIPPIPTSTLTETEGLIEPCIGLIDSNTEAKFIPLRLP